MRKLLYILLLITPIAWAELPLSFIETPTISNMAAGQVQLLDYTIKNNLRKSALPIQSVAVINNGDHQSISITQANSNCPKTLPPQSTCTVNVIINGPQQGSVNRQLKITYGGRAPLTAPINLMTSGNAAYTVLIYIVASDLETKSGAATFNINQMKEIGSTLNMNIVIETGGSKAQGFRTVQRRFILKNNEFLLQDLGTINMGLQSTVENFFEWGVRNFPANRYIAIFWNHGGGPNFGFGGDELFKNAATPINQLSSAMNNTTRKTGKRFEIIGFDTCLLGNIETFSGLYNYTNFLIGSQDLEPGLGWQYNTFLNFITKNPGSDGLSIGRIIVDGYTEQNKDDSTTLSVISAPAVPAVINAINQFSNALSPFVNSTVENWKQIARARLRTPDYSTSNWDNESYDVADLHGIANSAALMFPGVPSIQTTSNSLIAAVTNAVKYLKNSRNRTASFGLTIYFPSILAAFVTNYPNVTLINGNSFFTTIYTNLIQNYHNFYLAQKNNLLALPSNLTFDGTNYTAMVSNDFEEINALAGNDFCNNVFDNDGISLGAVPCYTAMQSDVVTATPAGGNTWTISYNKTMHATAWPMVNGKPVLFLVLDTEPVTTNEISFLVPVTKVVDNQGGYLNILLNANNQFVVRGFQQNVTNTRTEAKIQPIPVGTSFFIRTYALSNGSWGLFRTNVQITSPFVINTGRLPAQFNAFRFLVSDLTGALNITPTSQPY